MLSGVLFEQHRSDTLRLIRRRFVDEGASFGEAAALRYHCVVWQQMHRARRLRSCHHMSQQWLGTVMRRSNGICT